MYFFCKKPINPYLKLCFILAFLVFPCLVYANGHPQLTVHNIGQGNFVSLAVPHEEGVEFMVIDAGSSSIQPELYYIKNQKPLDEVETLNPPASSNVEGGQPSTPTKNPLLNSFPESSKKPVNPKNRDQDFKEKKKISEKSVVLLKVEAELLEDIRQGLSSKPSSKTQPNEQQKELEVYIKTIVISHPDQDHYNWLPKVIKEKDKVDFIIFAGLPSHYKALRPWIIQRLDAKSQIFFPAVQAEPIAPADPNNPLAEVMAKENQEQFAPQQAYNNAGDAAGFGEAFRFKNPDLQIALLSVNPLHVTEHGGVMRLADDEADDNKDSLILKITYHDHSVLLTGDATQATFRRIKNNYRHNLEFLKSTVLLAAHHGADSHGSNAQDWINLIQPEVVLISTGLKHGHPQLGAYENFKLSPRLKWAERHSVLVRHPDTYMLHDTHKGIFSTLNSGDLIVTLPGKNDFTLSYVLDRQQKEVQFLTTPPLQQQDNENPDPEEETEQERKKLKFSEGED